MKIIYWIFILIFVYLLVAYYRGSASVLSVFGDFVDKTILFLQGRDSTGKQTDYPHDPNVGYYN